jgi:hypothetical protein
MALSFVLIKAHMIGCKPARVARKPLIIGHQASKTSSPGEREASRFTPDLFIPTVVVALTGLASPGACRDMYDVGHTRVDGGVGDGERQRRGALVRVQDRRGEQVGARDCDVTLAGDAGALGVEDEPRRAVARGRGFFVQTVDGLMCWLGSVVASCPTLDAGAYVGP